MGTLADLRSGARLLLKSPGFTAVAVLTLALGIGANTAIFSVVDGVLLKPLPYEESERLVRVWGQLTRAGLDRLSVSQPEYLDYREQATSFEHLAAWHFDSFNIAGREKPDWAVGINAASDLFPLLRVKAKIGRVFTPEEAAPEAAPVCVVSHAFWKRWFDGDPEAIGRTISLDGELHTVVGVMPAAFAYPNEITEIWRPLKIDRANPKNRGSHYLHVVGRLGEGVSFEQAGAEMDAIAGRLEQDHADNYADSGWGIFLVPLKDHEVGDTRPALLVLLASVGFVLLIACANVASLLLSRAADREREVAIRTALGAGRRRLVRQLLTENLLLAGLGGGAGLLIAFWGLDLLTGLASGIVPRLEEVAVDGRVLTFTFLISAATGLLFGLVPALQVSKPDLTASLREGGRTSAGRRARRARAVLVVGEVALALVLLVSAGLMIRSFSGLLEVDPGYDPDGVLTARLVLTETRYPEDHQKVAFFDRLVERLAGLPGVRAASAVSELPMGGSYSSGTMSIEDHLGDPDREDLEVDRRVVTPGYFAAMKISILSGRGFTNQDREGSPLVAIIDETMARRFWPDSDPVGRRIMMGGAGSTSPWLTIVGVARHAKQYGLDVDGREQAYLPYPQRPLASMGVALRVDGDPEVLSNALRGAVLAIDPDQPIFFVRTMKSLVAGSVSQARFSMMLLIVFAVVALLLAAVGIYGITAHSVSQRTREFGIRMALGAEAADVVKMVLRQGLLLALAGLAIGVAGALTLTRFMSSLLFRISAIDPGTYAAVAILLTTVSIVAIYLPARRATRVDPMVALRYE